MVHHLFRVQHLLFARRRTNSNLTPLSVIAWVDAWPGLTSPERVDSRSLRNVEQKQSHHVKVTAQSRRQIRYIIPRGNETIQTAAHFGSMMHLHRLTRFVGKILTSTRLQPLYVQLLRRLLFATHEHHHHQTTVTVMFSVSKCGFIFLHN